MAETERTSEAERKAFIDKLAGFRTTLAPKEQGMLDKLVDAALMGRAVDEVSAYWVTGWDGIETRAPGQTADLWTNNPWYYR